MRKQSIPTTAHLPREIKNILDSIIKVVEPALLNGKNKRAVTREDLIDLGLITQADVDKLEK